MHLPSKNTVKPVLCEMQALFWNQDSATSFFHRLQLMWLLDMNLDFSMLAIFSNLEVNQAFQLQF